MSIKKILHKKTKHEDMEWLREKVKDMTVDQMQDMMEWEIEKPINRINADIINVLAESIIKAEGLEDALKQDVNESYKQFCEKYSDILKENNTKRSARINIKRCLPRFAALAACVGIVVFLASKASATSCSEKSFMSAVVKYADGAAKIIFNKQKVIQLPVSEGDPYGIRAKNAEYGVEALVPDYLPEGFELVAIDHNDDDVVKLINYHYEYNGIKLVVCYYVYNSEEDIFDLGIPSDENNIFEENINNRDIIISEEDNQFTAVFLDKNITYGLFTDGLGYDECRKVVASYN